MLSDKLKINLIIANGIVFLFFLFSLIYLLRLSLINSTNLKEYYFTTFVAIIYPLIFIFSFSCIYLLYSHKYNYAIPLINAALIYSLFLYNLSILDKIKLPIMMMDYIISFNKYPYLIQVLGLLPSLPSVLTVIFFIKAKKENELSSFENNFYSKSPMLKDSHEIEDCLSAFIKDFDIKAKKNVDLFIELLNKKNIVINKTQLKETIKRKIREREEESELVTNFENRIKPLVEEKNKLEDLLSKIKDKHAKKSISENSYNELCNKYSKQIQSIQTRIDEEKILLEMNQNKEVIPSTYIDLLGYPYTNVIKLESEKDRLKKILNEIEEQFISGKISDESYKELKEKYQLNLIDLENKGKLEKPVGEGGVGPHNDYGQVLGLLGFFIGGFLGYLNRPASLLFGQLPFETVITRGENLKEFDQLLIPLAQISFNYMITGAILGAIIGWVVGKLIKR